MLNSTVPDFKVLAFQAPLCLNGATPIEFHRNWEGNPVCPYSFSESYTTLGYTAGQIMDSGSPVLLSNCNLPLNQSQRKLMEWKKSSQQHNHVSSSQRRSSREVWASVSPAHHVSLHSVLNKAVARHSCNLDYYNSIFHQALGLVFNLKHLYTSPTTPQPLYCR